MVRAQNGFESSWRSTQQGFTLVEMMVALAVFSLAALALIRLEGASFREARALDRSQLAGIVARNVAVEAMTSAKVPVLGTEQGNETNGGRSWRWTRIVAPLGDGDRVYRIDVAVADDSGTAAKLTMVRDSPPPPPIAQPSPAATPGAGR
jgi:general secretion pathway protein I